MSDVLSFNPNRALTANIGAAAAAKAYFYDAGTANLKTVYADVGLTTAHPSPLLADSAGVFAAVFTDGTPAKVVVQTSGGSTLYTLDPADTVSVGVTDFDTVAELLADTRLTYSAGYYRVGAGNILTAGGFRYEVAASGASDQHVTTAGGVKLYVLRGESGFDVRAFGAKGDDTDDTTAIQSAFNAVKATGGRLAFPVPSNRYRITARIGTDQTVAGDLADDVELWFEPGTTVYYAPASSPAFGEGAIVLEGNRVSITGGLVLNSSKTITYASDPTPQRTPYYSGIIIGGKGNRRVTPVIGLEKSGALVQGATVTNFNLPITVYAASDVMVRDCVVTDDTDTGILIDDCLSNVEVCYNTVKRSFDDCFYARHYYNSPWALAGWHVGDYRVHHNHFTDTFAKSAGFGGIADVQFHNNFCKNTWYGAINTEIDGATTWYDNAKRIQIYDNIIVDAARNFDPTNTNLPAAQQAQVSNSTQRAGIIATTAAASYPANTFRDVTIRGNTIINPARHGVSASYILGLVISGNYMMPGRTTKNGVNYDTNGAAILIEEAVRVDITGNTIATDGTYTFPRCYDVNGGTYTSEIRVSNNPTEKFSSALFTVSDATVETTQFSYIGQNLTGSAAWAPGGFANGTTTTRDISVTPARLGDIVQATYSQDLQGLTLTGYVQSSGVVRCAFANVTGGLVSLTAGTVEVMVQRRN